MSFGTFATVVGLLLGVAAALDVILPRPTKIALAQAVRSLRAPIAPPKYRISNFLDRLFGPRIGSRRSFLTSIALSAISLLISYLFAYFTSDPSTILIFDSSPSWLSIWIFLIFMIGCLLGDFLSFAQTRIFLRAVDSSRQFIISVGLASADAAISLAIFIGTFSISRLIAYLIVIGTLNGGSLKSEQTINTAATKYAVSTLLRDGVARPNELEWPAFVGNVTSARDASVADELLRRYSTEVLTESEGVSPIQLAVEYKCEHSIESIANSAMDTTNLITRHIASRRALDIGTPAYERLQLDVQRRVIGWRPTSENCPLPILKISQQLTPGGLLKISGLWNALYASFERTMLDSYYNVGFKFAIYTPVMPYDGVGEYYASLIQQTKFGILGIGGNPSASHLLSEFAHEGPNRAENLRIPFSPMLASCLTVSILFWLYILVIYVFRVASVLQNVISDLFTRLNADKAPFTALSVSLSALLAVFCGIMFVLGIIWQAIL